MKTRLKFLFVFLILMVGASRAAAAESWWKLEADAVTIYTDSSAKTAELYAQDFDAMSGLVQAVLGREGYQPPRPIVVLFRREKDLAAIFGSVATEVDEEILQQTLTVDGRQVIAMTTSMSKETRVPANPGLLAAYGRAMPWWVAQGLHMVLEQRFSGSDIDYRGMDKKDFPERWSDDEVTPWEVFFSPAGRLEMMATDDERTALQARAWGIMSWLMDGHEGAERVQRFLSLMQDRPVPQALEAVAGLSLEELKVPILRSVRNRKAREEFRAWYLERKPIDAYEAVPLPEAERLALWSDAALANGRERDARKAFEQAKQAAPESLAVIELEARRAYKAGDQVQAYAHYLQAVEQGTENAWAHVSVASWQLQQLSAGEAYALGDIRDLMLRAVELSPGMVEAYQVLGTIGLVSPNAEPAVLQALSDRVGPDAVGAQARLYRAALRARGGETASALADLEMIMAEPEAPRNFKLSALQQWSALALPELQATVKAALAKGDVAAALAAVDETQAAETRSLAIDACKLLRAQIEQMAKGR